MNKFVIGFVVLLFSVHCEGQTGGNRIYRFLDLSNSARSSALGGTLISAADKDINLSFQNPAVGSFLADQAISFQHQFIFDGIQSGLLGYGQQWKGDSSLFVHAGLQYVTYGDFTQTDEFGNEIGSFSGNDLAIYLGGSYQLYDRLRLGASLKLINSNLDIYHSYGAAVDLGAYYYIPKSRLAIAFVIKNLGSEFISYNNERGSALPVDVQIGFSKRLKHLPFRFNVQFHHLQEWNLLYDVPGEENSFFIQNQNGNNGVDNFFRHVILSGELLLGKNQQFHLRVGYNHKAKQELSIQNISSVNGFSMGFGINTKKFSFDYASRRVHFAGSTHHLGLRTRI